MTDRHVRISVGDGSCHAVMRGEGGQTFRQGVRTVVFSHGFQVPGFESSRMFWKISRVLSSRGWQSVMFDYRGSGYSDLDFEEMTLQTEIEDLTQVLKYVRDEVGAEAEVCTWGMSLGTSVLAEVLKSDSARVAKTVLWGLSAELFERWHVRWQDQFDQQGYAILPSGYIVRPSVVEGMRGINTYRSLSSISIPILCVAGGADPGGELRMSKIAASECGANFKLVEYPTGMHAFKGQPDLLHEATDLTINWLDG